MLGTLSTTQYFCAFNCITHATLNSHLESYSWAPLKWVLQRFSKCCTTKQITFSEGPSAQSIVISSLNCQTVYAYYWVAKNGRLQIFSHVADIHFPSILNILTTSVCAKRASLSSACEIPIECKVRACLDSLVHLFWSAAEFCRNHCIPP